MARMKFIPAAVGEKKTHTPVVSPRSPAAASPSQAPNESLPCVPSKSTDGLSAESKMPLSEFLKSEIQWAKSTTRKDHLLHLPPKNHLYVDKNGVQRVLDTRYDPTKSPYSRSEAFRRRRLKKPHPKLVAARANKTVNDRLEAYYMYFETSTHKGQLVWHHIPLAGKSRAEDAFHARPSIKLPMADHLKAMLVDDWENVTKNQQLVPIPHAHPVEQLLNDYVAHERPRREEGSAAMDVLDEVVAGLREYFNKALGRILLYKFERPQYIEMYKMWEDAQSKYKSPCDTYGAEHLCRLLVSLPELIAQTNMDQQSVNRLREELTAFTGWLAKHSVKYFVSEYDTAGQDYIDKARA